MISVQLMTHEKRLLAEFVIQSKENQKHTYNCLSVDGETGGPLLIAMKQVYKMLNNCEVDAK